MKKVEITLKQSFSYEFISFFIVSLFAKRIININFILGDHIHRSEFMERFHLVNIHLKTIHKMEIFFHLLNSLFYKSLNFS